ncbi:hypothetical protein TcYC6_0038570 [Trypanosoma cruzi]|nr:hypothetical protein TcYC6_0038570 [Trypanosoma cruzi]
MADLLPGNGNLRIQSRPVRLLGTTGEQLLNCVPHPSTAAKRTMPRRYQLRPVAQTGVSHHTMRSFLVVCVRSVFCTKAVRQSHRVRPHSPPQPGSATSLGPMRSNEGYFCPPGNQLNSAAEYHRVPRTHTARTPPNSPLYRGRAWRDLLGNHSLSNTWEGSNEYSAGRETPSSRNRDASAATWDLPGPHPHPHAEQRIVARDAVSRNEVGVFQPRHAKDTPDGVRRSPVEAACASLGSYDAGR